ncbi:MAG: hypothetical protein IIV29_06850, partial [Tidjanibacter sp.]|nr:hypothetical protein [Tidjanibacter sp.]
TPELLQAMNAQNPNIRAWYADYPYACMDDPCSKGITFSMGQGEPYSNKYFRWGLALALNMVEVSENIFDGIGRSSVLQTPATLAMHNSYYTEMQDWLKEFTIEGLSVADPKNCKVVVFALVRLSNGQTVTDNAAVCKVGESMSAYILNE